MRHNEPMGRASCALAPQDRRGAVAGLPGERGHGDAVEPGTHPRVTAIMKA
jgi:hypothetical protein